MKVILNAAVDGIGRAGDVCTVPDGYARNFLFPKKLAAIATAAAMANADHQRQKKAQDQRDRQAAEDLAARALTGRLVTIKAPANPQGHLFGGVSRRMIAEALKGDGFDIPEGDILLERAIDRIGNTDVRIKIAGRTIQISVNVMSKT